MIAIFNDSGNQWKRTPELGHNVTGCGLMFVDVQLLMGASTYLIAVYNKTAIYFFLHSKNKSFSTTDQIQILYYKFINDFNT